MDNWYYLDAIDVDTIFSVLGDFALSIVLLLDPPVPSGHQFHLMRAWRVRQLCYDIFRIPSGTAWVGAATDDLWWPRWRLLDVNRRAAVGTGRGGAAEVNGGGGGGGGGGLPQRRWTAAL